MNQEWSELNRTMQAQIKKKDTYSDGISTLSELRDRLMQTIISFRNHLSREDYNAIPFINADGCHSKTIAYSLWHIFRIEDIVAHTLINGDEQIFFSGNYKERIHSPIILMPQLSLEVICLSFCRDTALEILALRQQGGGFLPCLTTKILRIYSSRFNWYINIMSKSYHNDL